MASFIKLLTKLKSSVKKFNQCFTSETHFASNNHAVKNFEDIATPKVTMYGRAFQLAQQLGIVKGDFFAAMMKLRQDHGDNIRIPSRHGQSLITFDADLAKSMYMEVPGVCPIRQSIVARDYYFNHQNLFKTLSASQGDVWHELRSKVQKYLLLSSLKDDYSKKINEVADDLIEQMKVYRDPNNFHVSKDFYELLQKWSLETLAYVTLGKRIGCMGYPSFCHSDGLQLHQISKNLFHRMHHLEYTCLWKYFPTPTRRQFVKEMDSLMMIIGKFIRERSKKIYEMDGNDVCGDLLGHILKDHDETTANALIIDLISGGVDTIANTIGKTLHILSKNPDAQEKLRKEILSIAPCKNAAITEKQRGEMKYLVAVIRESMRLMPTVPANTRTMVKKTLLDNYVVPEGTVVIAMHGLMGLDEKYFKDANAFIPERWMDRTSPFYRTHSAVFLPFGNGTRKCVAFRLANQEMEIVIAKIMQNFRLKCTSPQLKQEYKLNYQIASPIGLEIHDID